MPRVPDMPCAGCGKMMWRGKTSLPEGQARCRDCRKSAVAHGSQRMYRDGCRCEECRKGNAERNHEHVKNYRTRNGSKTHEEMRTSCMLCGEEMISQGGLYPLHRECKDRVPLWMRQSRPGPAQARALRVIAKASKGSSGRRVFTSGACRWCGENFVGVGMFCSRSCAGKASFAARDKGFSISRRDRIAIYERDAWKCQLCGLDIDQSANYQDSFAPSLDHIIPQSQQLIPDHSASNLRTTHRICNSLRGDGSNMIHDELVRRVHEMAA